MVMKTVVFAASSQGSQTAIQLLFREHTQVASESAVDGRYLLKNNDPDPRKCQPTQPADFKTQFQEQLCYHLPLIGSSSPFNPVSIKFFDSQRTVILVTASQGGSK